MPGRNLGDVFIVVNPDTRLFGSMTDAQVRKALAGINPNVRIGADTKGATAAITSFQTRIRVLSDALSQLRLDVKDDRAAAAKIAGFQAKVLALAKSMAAMTMSADTKKIDAQIAAKLAQVKDLQLRLSKLQADADTKNAAAKIASLEAEAFHLQESLNKGKLKADVDITRAETRLEAIDAELRVLSSNARAVKLSADNKNLLAAIGMARSDLAGLRAQAKDIRLGANVDPAKLLAAESSLLGLEAAMEKLAPAAVAGDAALGVLGKALTGTGTGWGFLTRSIVLFGGAFNRVLPVVAASVAVWHVLADAIIELGAVWIPAALAVGAFAVAASDAATEIVRRMQAVHTVMDATGQAVPPLTNKLEQLHKAVQPQVYQLFGDALTIVNSRTGTFQQVAKATGTVLDQLGARIVYAVTSSNKLGTSTTQLSGFWKTAISDVSKLGDSIGNVFGIFGNFFKAIPGFAAGLLTIGDDFTKILETASAAAVPLLKWVLLLHGYILYTGLAVTATLAFIGGMANLAKQFFTFAAGSVLAGIAALKSFGSALVTIGLSLAAYVESIIVADGASASFAAALAPLAANPMLWVAAAAVALGALVFEIVRSKDAAQQFNDTMQQTIANASLSSVVSVIQNAQSATTAKLAQSTQQLNAAIKTNVAVNAGRAGTLNSNGAAISRLATATDGYRAGLVHLDAQQQLVTSRFSVLTKQYGSGTAALGLLNAAGITGAQITDKNSQKWAQALIQISSTVQAYQAMGTQAGVLGNDLDVLGRTVTDQYQAVQKLNQGWSAFISDVTGTQGSFDMVAQGFSTLNDHSGTLRLTLGKLKVAYSDNHAAIDDLTPAGIALNQAFGDQVVNLDKLFASWRTAGLAGNLFTAGVKDGIAPLLKYANGSQEATAQLVALAQEAGYQGPISMQALTKWLGNTHGATQKLKDITNQATTQEALLTGAMQAQGSYIANTLLGDINNAILKYGHVRDAAAAYGQAVAQSGRDSDAAHQARNRLITDLALAGKAAGDSTGQIAAMITKVLGIPPKEALQILMTGDGSFRITTGTGQAPGTHTAAGRGGGFAAGGYIDMGSGPVADDVPIMASKGEYVVQAKSVSKYGRAAMDRINAGAFANGGPVGRYAGGGLLPHAGNLSETGNTDVLTGQYAVTQHDQFRAVMQAAFISAMRAELFKQKAAAQAKARGALGSASGLAFASGPAASGSALAAQNYAKSILWAYGWGQDQFPPLLSLWNQESGWNAWAVNPSSGAYGIPQSLGHGHPYNLGDYANQVRWGLAYISQRYGSPAAAWAHERAFNWYALGGIVEKMAAGGLIPGMAAGGTVTGLRSRLAGEQRGEQAKYSGLVHSFLAGPAKYRTRTVMGELATLAKRQRAELEAYSALSGTGLTTTRLHRLGAVARAEERTARDQGLTRLPGGHPGFAHDLRKYLHDLSVTASGTVPAGAAAPKMTFPAWLGKLKTTQAHEVSDYRGLESAFKYGLAHAPHKSWLYTNRKALGERLYAVAIRQNAEAAAYSDLMKHSSGSVADLGGMAGRISKLGSQARAEAGSLQPSLLGHLPGGHPGWVKALQTELSHLASLAAAPPYSPPWNPGNLGPSHTVPGGVLRFRNGGRVFDSGGVLQPGPNLAWNMTGRDEHLVPAGGAPATVQVELNITGGDQELVTLLRRIVRVRGGGSVQTAFGRPGAV